MNDLISRRAAIEALTKEYYYHDADYMTAISVIHSLPSAQPEIIRCKDCKHYWIHKCMDSMPIERCDLEQTFYGAEVDYCSLAERIEVTE